MGIQTWEISEGKQALAGWNHQEKMRAKRVSAIFKVFFGRKRDDFHGGKQSFDTDGGEQELKEGEEWIGNTDSPIQSTRNEVVGVSFSIYGQPPK